VDEIAAVTIYDCDRKKPVAVYKTITLVVKELFPKAAKQKMCIKVKYAISHKRRLSTELRDYKIAVRYSNAEHIALLGDKDFIILDLG